MADTLAALDKMNEHIALLARVANTGRSRYLTSPQTQPIARAIATTYFESIRTELDAIKSRGGLVEEIDFVVQQILELASGQREKQAYIGQLNELRPFLLEASLDLLKSRGTARLVLSEIEQAILETLAALLPSSAASYEQALLDIARGARVSWRGTATELRETLREVIDHFAPDEKVAAGPGFQLEANQRGPTQRQKVRYILKARRSSKPAVAVVEASLNTVEEAVAALARSTYQRGSVSTHTATTGKENYKEFWYSLVGLNAESQNFDGNGNYVRFQAGGGTYAWATGPYGPNNPKAGEYALQQWVRSDKPPLGTSPAYTGKVPPYVSTKACKDQKLPGVNSHPAGPADGTAPGGSPAAELTPAPVPAGDTLPVTSLKRSKSDVVAELAARLNPLAKAKGGTR